MKRVYLDHNATTPPHADVLAAMHEADREGWGNPSSIHHEGRCARRYLDEAREAIAQLVGGHPRDVVLTSSGTEANNLALQWLRYEPTSTLITSRLEHPSVVATAESLGVEVRWLPVRRDGVLDPDDLDGALASARGTKLVAIHVVHHETGVLQPIEACLRIAERWGAHVHVDLVQAAGRVPLGVLAWTTATVSAHKLRGPKGIGALLMRPQTKLVALVRGGSQERGLRAGTVSPTLAAGFAVAARRALDGPERYMAIAPLRDRLLCGLKALGAEPTTPARTAPHVAHVRFAGLANDALVAALDLEGVAASAGPACAAGTPEPSPAIVAMAGRTVAKEVVRFSLGEDTSADDIDRALRAAETVVRRFRRGL